METNITIADIKGLIRRRIKLFSGLFAVFLIAAVVVALALPPIYRSQAVILIEAQQIPDEYVKSTITSYPEQRLEMLNREILRNRALKDIIHEFDLYPDYLHKGDFSSAVQEMKAAIEVEPISSKVGLKSYTVAFILSYEGKNPQKTYAVVDRLSQLYLQKETEVREKQAAATTGFLETELENLKAQIKDHEDRITDFKQRHISELPGSQPANLSTLQRLEREEEQIKNRIRSLQDRKIYLKGQMANIEPLRPIQTESGQVASNPQERLKLLRLNLIRARALLSEKHPDIKKMINEIAELEKQVGQTDTTVVKIKQLNAMRAELKALEAGKGEKHPDVVVLSKQIDELAKEVDSLLTDDAAADLSAEKPDNPAYINLMTQVASADLEIKNLNEDLVDINSQIDEYQEKVERAPIVEREFNELTIDYQNAKARYNEIAGKLLQAKVAQEMEIQQQGEHFTITDPPYVPTRPSKPNRLAIVLLGFVLATGAALGGAAFKEATDHTIKDVKDLIKFEGVDLLTAMPYTPTPEERRQRWVKRVGLVAGSIVLAGAVLIFVDRLVLPLNDMISFVSERLTYF